MVILKNFWARAIFLLFCVHRDSNDDLQDNLCILFGLEPLYLRTRCNRCEDKPMVNHVLRYQKGIIIVTYHNNVADG